MSQCTACRGEIRDPSALRCPFCGTALRQAETRTSAASVAAPVSDADREWPALDGARFAPGYVFAARFRIVCLLGRGGGGEVYRADDLRVGQAVALKLLSNRATGGESGLAALAPEVRLSRTIAHANVCRVFDMGEADGRHFLSMEYVDGETLAALHRRIGRLPTEKAVDVARQLCAGVAAAHDRGVLHRDLKPSNIMLDGRGCVRIVDFGLAVGVNDRTYGIAGTPAYMAPEQVTGGAVSQRTDIYALGLVLCELFTGRRLFDATTFEERTRSDPNATQIVFGDDVDPKVADAIRRCLHVSPALRPVDALHVAAALPGGDPVAAALQAGRVPRPDLIAAGGIEGTLQPGVAWSLLCAVLAIIILVAHTAAVLTFSPSHIPKPPEALAERSAQILAGLNHDEWKDREFWYQPEPSAAGRSSLQFVYRQSSAYLEPDNPLHRVTESNPPFNTEGMATIVLDPAGRLMAMSRLGEVPPTTKTASIATWSSLLSAAGLSAEALVETRPEWRPPVPHESVVAWSGRDGARPHVSGAAVGGTPVHFEVRDGVAPSRPAELVMSTGRTPLSEAALLAVIVGMFITTIVMARRHMRAKEGDLDGASKLTRVVVIGSIIGLLFRAHHVPNAIYEVSLVLSLTAWSLLWGGFIWLAYVSFEPHVRRLWPGTLVSWTRLLSGRLRDPLVGRDMLIGVLAGSLVAGMGIARIHLSHAEPPALLVGPALIALRSPRHLTAMMIAAVIDGILFAFASFFTLVFVRLIVRATWLALILNLVLVVLVSASVSSAVDIAYGVAIGTLFYAVFLRIGVLAGVFAIVTERLLTRLPLTLDATAWYFGSSLTVLLFVLALAIASASIAVQRRQAERPRAGMAAA